MDYNTTSSFDSFELQLPPAARDFLKGAANWATVLAILGFIGLAFLVLMGIMVFAAGSFIDSATASAASPFPMSILGGVYIVMAVIYFFPVYFLYKFSSDAKWALNNNSADKIITSFKNLKAHFQSIVIIIIITIVFYIVAIAVFAATMASTMNNFK